MIESEYISTPSISIYPSFLKWSFPILSLLNIIQLRQNSEFFWEKEKNDIVRAHSLEFCNEFKALKYHWKI